MIIINVLFMEIQNHVVAPTRRERLVNNYNNYINYMKISNTFYSLLPTQEFNEVNMQ